MALPVPSPCAASQVDDAPGVETLQRGQQARHADDEVRLAAAGVLGDKLDTALGLGR